MQLTEERADGAIVNEVGDVVERRGVAIDDGEQRAAALGDDRKTRHGTNGSFPPVGC